MPAVRNAKPALAWRYPRRAPVEKRITSPPAPGKAPAASAHSETGSRSSPKTCRKDDPAPIGNAASGASGAIPDTADARPSAITSSGATPVASPVAGRPETPASGGPEIPASGRPSGNRDATDAPAAADSPGPCDASHSAHYGLHPGDAQQEGKRSEGSCASRTTALGNRAEHVLNQRADIRNWRHPGDAQQEGIKVGLQLRERDDRTGNRGQHVLNQRLQLRERDDRTGNRGGHVLNQRDDVRNWRDQIGYRRDHIRN